MVSFFTLFIALVVVNIALLLFSVLRTRGISLPFKDMTAKNSTPRVLSLDSKETELKEAI